MPYYSDDIIEEVRSRNDIVDVISQYVRLSKKGSTYFGLCPFHNEKTGSFSVSPNKHGKRRLCLQTSGPFPSECGAYSKIRQKVLYKDFGEMMFTHFGVTGPLILSASAQIGKKLEKEPLEAFLDLKPALDAEQLDARILREFDANHNKQFKNVIGVLFPSSLTPIMIEIGGIPGEKPVHEISREERQAFGRLIKAFPFTITGMGEFKEAIITRGGVSVKEIQPSTMESKK